MQSTACRHIAIALLCLLIGSGSAHAVEIQGVEFPLGAESFADAVTSFTVGAGSTTQTDATQALGIPTEPANAVSLGNQGILVVEFVDNRLVDQDTVEGGLDLFVFEVGATGGGVTENFKLEISLDNMSYIDLGNFQGETLGVDIKPFITPGDEFRFVRITDLLPNNTGAPVAGADIDAVGAIGSVLVPEPAGLALATLSLLSLAAFRRR